MKKNKKPIDAIKDNPLPLDYASRKKKDLERQTTEGYRVQIIFRGEDVLYQVGNKSLKAMISWYDGLRLYANSICSWETPNVERLTEQERKLAIERIYSYLSCEGSVIIEEN